jgi:flagellar assembly protein FliH
MKMSTSYSPAFKIRSEPKVEAFSYAEVEIQNGAGSTTGTIDSAAGEAILVRRETAAREAGRQEGEAGARAAAEGRLIEIRESVGAALAAFDEERARYFQQVENEVVQLALSIARKVLHREAQIDPLLLAGMVRIALEKMESATQVVVRVHPRQVSEFRGYFAQHMGLQNVPEVLEDPAVAADQCVLQTALGTTELGVELQLKEIEQGLFDLLAKRPATP